MNFLSNKITNLFLKYKIIEDNDYDIYQFGIYQGFSFIINCVTTLFVLSIYNMYIEGFVFCVFYFMLRSYGGGYHSKSVLVCYILSALLIAFAMRLIQIFGVHTYVLLISIPSIIFIYIKSPIETETKKLDTTEKIFYKKKVRLILIIACICIVISYLLNQNTIMISVIWAVIFETIMQLLGILNNSYIEKLGEK